jgi:glycosyltransferase involved in cell wall biosynthesis
MAGLVPYKRPEFLIEAAVEIRRHVPDFELVIIGDGPMRGLIEDASREHQWIHWLGGMYGDDRLGPAALCALQLMPGLVGLNIVDGFALGMPTVTIEAEGHGPEIDYVDDDVNGVVLPEGTSAAGYAARVVELLEDDSALRAMREEADRWGERLSIEDMAERFIAGTKAALAADRRG